MRFHFPNSSFMLLIFLAISNTSIAQTQTTPNDTYAIQTQTLFVNQKNTPQRISVIDIKSVSGNPATIFDAYAPNMKNFSNFTIVGGRGNPKYIFAHAPMDSLHVAPMTVAQPKFTIPPAFINNGLDITAMTPFSENEVLVATKSGQMYTVHGDGTNRTFGQGPLWLLNQTHGNFIAIQMIGANGNNQDFAALTNKGRLLALSVDTQTNQFSTYLDIDISKLQTPNIPANSLFQGLSENFIASKDSAWIKAKYSLGTKNFVHGFHIEYRTGKVMQEDTLFGVSTVFLDFETSSNKLLFWEGHSYQFVDGKSLRTMIASGAFNSTSGYLQSYGIGTRITQVQHPNSNLWFGLSSYPGSIVPSPSSLPATPAPTTAANAAPKKIALDPTTAEEFRDAIEAKALGLPEQLTKSHWAKFLSKSIYSYDINDAKNHLSPNDLDALGFQYLWHDEIKPFPGRENETVKLKDMLDGFSVLFASAKKAKCAAKSASLLTNKG